ncbi:hypothetical protein ACPFTS_002047 [Vibrio cholerae]
MSEPTVQDLVKSVDALGKTTSELVERYTEAIFGVEASAGSAAEDAKKTAADRVQTGLDAAQAEQAKLDAQQVTQLSTFKQYRDQAQLGATTSANKANVATEQATLATNKANVATEQATLATNKANVATEQATLATNKANVATEQATLATNKANVATQEATNSATQAGIATQKAQAASGSERVVLQKAQEVSNNASLVATHTATVVRKSEEVAANTTVVEEKTAVVIEKASEVSNNAIDIASRTVGISQAVSEALRNRRKNQYAASGFVHWGKHYKHANPIWGSPVNEGMTCLLSAHPLYSNKLWLGSLAQDGYAVGESETLYPVLNLAGYEVRLDTHGNYTEVKFPEAPDGTVIYDSSGNCRGTGKATLNLLTDIDPKYGDVAADRNEAVARAFEGMFENGDFRNGLDGNWSAPVGVDGQITEANNINPRTSGALVLDLNRAYVIEVVISDYVEGRLVYTNYGLTDVALIAESNGVHTATFTPTISDKLGYHLWCMAHNGSNGFTGKIKSVSIKPATEEVVTERVDMFGFEFFKEKVGEYLYPYGCIQSQLTTVDGVPTTVDNSRPITYFAVFDGDTSSRGRGWKLADLTFVQLATVLSNPEHNAWYNEKGELIQFRVRQRTIAGAGNGDWEYINPSHIDYVVNRFNNHTRLNVQGSLNSIPDGSLGGIASAQQYIHGKSYGTPELDKITQEMGIWGAGIYGGSPLTGVAIDGECYFYVCGVVPRLNQGAYHPSFNPLGTRFWRRIVGGVGVGDSFKWYEVDNTGLSKVSAFIQSNVGDTHNGHINVSGYVGSTYSNHRPDNRFYDAIYPDGLGGVIDYRLPAKDMGSKEEAAKIFQKVVNGTYRGLESLKETIVTGYSYAVTNFWLGRTYVGLGAGNTTLKFLDWVTKALHSGMKAWIALDGEWFELHSVGSDSGNGTYWYINSRYGDLTSRFSGAANKSIVLSRETNLSVSGNFLQSDVIGSPAEILKVNALKNGWMGSWIPVIPDGAAAPYPYTRKNVSAVAGKAVSTTTSGASWGESGLTTAPNSVNKFGNADPAITSSHVYVIPYTAFAKQTKPSVNKLVLNGSAGLGDVWAGDCYYAPNYGVLLGEALLGKVFTNDTHRWLTSAKLTHSYLANNGNLDWTSSERINPKHEPIDLTSPNNASPAAKALWYQTADNKQVSLNFAWNELVWGAGQASWGDDSTIRIINGIGTFNNLNGAVCLYGTSELAIPYGYTKG